jgi:hypothetical protein
VGLWGLQVGELGLEGFDLRVEALGFEVGGIAGRACVVGLRLLGLGRGGWMLRGGPSKGQAELVGEVL